jgi:hypothetical protein
MKFCSVLLSVLFISSGQCTPMDVDARPTSSKSQVVWDSLSEKVQFFQTILSSVRNPREPETWVQENMRDLTEEIVTTYAREMGFELENLPLLFVPVSFMGKQTQYALSDVGKIDRSVFSKNVLNNERMRGFVFGQAEKFSLKQVYDNKAKPQEGQYLVRLTLLSEQKNQNFKADYVGMIDLSGMPANLELTGPDGSRMSFEFSKEIREKSLGLGKLKAAFKDLLNLRPLKSPAVFHALCKQDLGCIRDIKVGPSVPDEYYALRYDASSRVVQVNNISHTWKVLMETGPNGSGQVYIDIDPDILVIFSSSFDLSKDIPNVWFMVDRSIDVPGFNGWNRIDWRKVPLDRPTNFGQFEIQNLLLAMAMENPRDAYREVKKLVPYMIKRLEELKDRTSFDDAATAHIVSRTSSAITSPRDFSTDVSLSDHETMFSNLNRTQSLPRIRPKHQYEVKEVGDI